MRLIMRTKKISITAFLIILLTNIGLSSAFAQSMIEQILFNSPAANKDEITFKMNGAYLPKSFALNGDRPRIVFDFPDVVPSKKIQNNIPANGTFIKSIRTGIHKGDNPKTRIVLDLQPGMKIDIAQNFDNDSNTLVISIFAAGRPPEPTVAEEEKAKPGEEKVAQGAPEPQPQSVPEEKTIAEAPEPITVTVAAPPKTDQPEPIQQDTEAETVEPPPTPGEITKEAGPEKQPEKDLPTADTVKMASIPQSKPETPVKPGLEESTVIQPLSEIGEKEKAAKEEDIIPTLYSVEFDNTSHRGEIVAFKLNGFNPPVVFGIEEDIPRIVCFFKDTSAGEKLGELVAAEGKFIKNIKIGKYRNPDNIRVVLDLVPGKNYDLQQIFFKEDNLFMVIIKTTGEKIVN